MMIAAALILDKIEGHIKFALVDDHQNELGRNRGLPVPDTAMWQYSMTWFVQS
jgi:hypothetical protein